MVSMTKVTRAYRIHDYQIDAWIQEGWFPAYQWCNGRRYWDSNTFNNFVMGSTITPKTALRNSTSSAKIDLLPYLLSGIALIVFSIF